MRNLPTGTPAPGIPNHSRYLADFIDLKKTQMSRTDEVTLFCLKIFLSFYFFERSSFFEFNQIKLNEALTMTQSFTQFFGCLAH